MGSTACVKDRPRFPDNPFSGNEADGSDSNFQTQAKKIKKKSSRKNGGAGTWKHGTAQNTIRRNLVYLRRFRFSVCSGIRHRRDGHAPPKSKMDSFKLIENFGERLGMTLGHNPNGVYLFEIDGRAFSIHDIAECDRIVLCGDLGHPPPESTEKLCTTLLEAQHMLKGTAGATFSIDPETGNISLCKALVPAILDNDAFFRELESFIDTLHTWADIIADFRAKATPDGETLPHFRNSGFISV